MKKMRYIQLAFACILMAMSSCTKEHEPVADDSLELVPAVMDVTIGAMDAPQTRHNVDNTTDHWTTRSFAAGDRLGLFATSGIVGPDGMPGWIKNEYMTNEQAAGSSTYRFRNDNLMLNIGMLSNSTVGKYVYYPYTDEMPVPYFDPTNISKTSDGHYYYYADPTKESTTYDPEFRGQNKKGLRLRQNVDGVDRCVDYMFISSISLTNGALGGGFYHGFCEMIILRGEGFDKVPDTVAAEDRDKITVALTAGYTRMTLALFLNNNTGQYSWRTILYYLDNDGCASAEEAKRWEAWKGEDYIDSDNGEPVPREAWYVILPTRSHSLTTVNYVELYDNDGVLQRVSNFDLYVNPDTGIGDKYMRYNKRYALEVMMVEAGATIRPHEISDWEEGLDGSNDITDERTAGINNYDDFYNWAIAYNYFITNVKSGTERPKTKEEVAASPLSLYGDYDLDNKLWMFYINGDINLPSNAPVGIDELQDILEGASSFSRYSISNLKGTFINTISGNGCLRNLEFDNLYVKPSSSSYYNNTAGALTNHLNGGSIENCSINNGTMVGSSAGDIGMLCGTVSSGSVTNCSASGAVIGSTFSSGTYAAGLFGKVETGGAFTYRDNDTEGLIIKSN